MAAFEWLSQWQLSTWALSYSGGLIVIAGIGAALCQRHCERGRLAWALLLWAMLAAPASVLEIGLAKQRYPLLRTPNLFERASEFSALASGLSLVDRVYFFQDSQARLRQDWSVVQKSASLFELRGVADYEPQVSKRFADILLVLRGTGPYQGFTAFELSPEEPRNRRILNLLGARFVVGNASRSPTFDDGNPPLRELYRDGRFQILENETALPRALYVPAVEVVPDEAAVLRRLTALDFDPRKSALIEQYPEDGFLGTPDSSGSATIESDRGEHLRIVVNADRPGFLFVSDQDAAGWSATVNGSEAPILRANYAFRLVRVPAGESIVLFRYRPQSVRLGALLSLSTAIALCGLIWVRRSRTTRSLSRRRTIT